MTSWIDEAVREEQRRDMLRDAARRRLIAQARVADRRPRRIHSPALVRLGRWRPGAAVFRRATAASPRPESCDWPAMARAAARSTIDASLAWIIVRTRYGAQGLIAWALLPTPPGCRFISGGRLAVLAYGDELLAGRHTAKTAPADAPPAARKELLCVAGG